MSGRSSSLHLSSVNARQINPRPCLAMKLIASGVTFSAAMQRSPSFSRSSSSTMITNSPRRDRSAASSMVGKGIGLSNDLEALRGLVTLLGNGVDHFHLESVVPRHEARDLAEGDRVDD